MEVTRESFHNWRSHPVTTVIKEKVENLVKEIDSGLLNEEILLNKDSRVIISRLLGQKDALMMLLGIKVEDVIGEEDVKDNASGTQSSGKIITG